MSGRKILVAVDGSAPSKLALRYAAGQCRVCGAGILALRVINTPRFSQWIAAHEKLEEEMRDEAERILAEARAIAAEYRVEAETAVREGYPDEEIVKAAQEDPEVVMVVMGASGKNVTQRKLLGSVTQKVTAAVNRSLPCPVVVVPGDEAFLDRLGMKPMSVGR
ncbi:MAG: universal stress protein [Nitrospirae bacterium]|nr:universal stress protein [Nitrospirota bacterium]MBI3393012.1 universal stress protein [Nitrospirota bacterium]